MPIAKKHLGVLTLVICLLVALTCGRQVAMAEGDFPPEGQNTLKVTAIKTTDEGLKADIAKANVVVDVYKVADAVADDVYVKYDYILVEPFGEGALNYDGMDADAWMQLAVESAKLVTADTPHQTIAANSEATLTLEDGLYLLIPHGANVTPSYGASIADSLKAEGEEYKYSFLTSLLVAPSKEPGPDGTISTAADAGDWIRTIEVTIKPEYEKITPPPEPTPTPDPTPEKKTPAKVQTGDNTELFPYYIAMTVSGVLLALIAVSAVRRRRSKQADGSGKGDA